MRTAARERCVALPAYLGGVAVARIDATTDPEIALLPYRIWRALGKRGDELSPALLQKLAIANLYGWMAYTIYDDFLDGEGGEPLLLSAANYFLRELTLQYATLGEDPLQSVQIPNLYRTLMNVIDNANIREQQCVTTAIGAISTTPETSLHDLTDRSIGHALPAVVLFLALGAMPDSPEVAQLFDFFRHYLAARQLHDDAHDWKDDLLRGRLNSVGARLVGAAGAEGIAGIAGTDAAATVHAIPELQHLFWRSEIKGVVAEIHSHIALAREALHAIALFEDCAPLEALLDSLDRAATKTLNDRALAAEFFKEYAV